MWFPALHQIQLGESAKNYKKSLFIGLTAWFLLMPHIVWHCILPVFLELFRCVRNIVIILLGLPFLGICGRLESENITQEEAAMRFAKKVLAARLRKMNRNLK